MILSDRDIRKSIEEKKIVIKPELKEEQIQPACIDLTLGNEFRVFNHSESAFIDPKIEKDCTKLIKRDKGKAFILHPGEFVLGGVNEYIKLPDDIAGAVDGKSSLGRLGIVVHLTSTFANPGWGGRLVLEMTNAGKLPVKLYPGMRICKFVFFRLTSPAEVPYDKKRDAKYNDQERVDPSRYSKEFKE